MDKVFAKKCAGCGAVTVEIDGESFSMPERWYRRLFPGNRLQHGRYNCCDHCVNNWGIDLCNCGSGNKAGHCHELPTCNGTPMQTLGVKRVRPLWAS